MDSAYEGLVAVDGLCELLAPSLPRLRSLALSGLSLVPFSSLLAADHHRYLPRGCADRCARAAPSTMSPPHTCIKTPLVAAHFCACGQAGMLWSKQACGKPTLCLSGCARPQTFATLQFPTAPAFFPTLAALTCLELSATHLGNLANLPALPNLVRLQQHLTPTITLQVQKH